MQWKATERSTTGKKFGNLSVREILVLTSAYVRTYVRTDSREA